MQQPQHLLTIRKSTSDDDDVVSSVFEAAFASLRSIYRPGPSIANRQVARASEGTRLVAELDGEVVATVQFDSHQNHVHVIGLAVHPDYQRIGVARYLLDWIVAHAPTLGHDVVVLDTIKETGNVALFEKMGFSVFDEQVTECFESDTFPQLHEVKMQRSAH